MTEKIDDGGSAFPEIVTYPDEDRSLRSYSNVMSQGGMSLRDYFAAQAMAAMIGTAAAPCLSGLGGIECVTAEAAYAMADAMIAARKVSHV